MLLAQDPFRAFMPYPPVEVPSAPDGPLAGLTLGIKDIFDVAGYRTGSGCPTALAMSDTKDEHAGAVARLLNAGARFVGKTQTDELAWSMYGMNAHFGTPLNPAAPGRIPGGSSSGSASAVAGGLCDLALGSDTGGSVRAPASFCGLWGMRPTQDLIAMDGAQPVAPSYDTPGLFARDGATLHRGMSALVGRDKAPLGPEPERLRPASMVAQLSGEGRARFDEVFGTGQREVEVYPEGIGHAYGTFLTSLGGDAARHVVPFIRSSGMVLVRGLRERAAAAEALPSDAVAAADAARAAFARHMANLLTGAVILAPVVHTAPFELDPDLATFDGFRHVAQRLLCVAGLAGLPQVVFPAGNVDGGPLGLSLIGPRESDLSLIDLARRMAGS